jgi:signal transduction histidine kinase
VYPEAGPDRPVPKDVVIAVAHDTAALTAARRAVLAWCGGVCLALVALVGALSWWSVTRGLAPSNRLAARLDAIDAEHLPERLEAGPLPRELRPVADTIDSLIARVGEALDRERRTTADIAHQLRTPISEIVTTSEVALMDGQDAGTMRRALGTVREVAWRMGRAVATLLKFARLETGHERFENGPVDLGAIVTESLRSLSSLERERNLDVANRLRGEDWVEGDPDVLQIVVSNLLSNALYYSPEGGVIECRLERSNHGGWSLVVENPTADLEPADLASIAQPFWRKDGARTDPDRSGLGLALSRAMVGKTGQALRFELEGSTFRAVLAGGNGNGNGSGIGSGNGSVSGIGRG